MFCLSLGRNEVVWLIMPLAVCSQAWLARGGIAGSLASILALGGCSHDWDAYDPRGGPSAGGAGGSGGSGAVTSSATTSTTTGAGGSGGMGGAGGAGGGGNPQCGPSGLLLLQDDFDDGVVGPAWTANQYNAAVLAVQGGALEISLPDPSDPAMYAGLYSVDHVDLSGCGLMARVLEVPSPATSAYAHMSIDTDDGTGSLEFLAIGGDLVAKRTLDGMESHAASAAYDPVQHAYWRLRESGGDFYWETSPDAAAWQVLFTEPAAMPLTLLHVGIGAGTYQVEPAPPGAFRVDAVNTPP